jgi:hypothetical protein
MTVFIVSLPVMGTTHTLLAQPPASQPFQKTSASPEDDLSRDLQRLTNQVLQLELEVAKTSKFDSTLTTAIIAGSASLVAVLLAGGLTLLGQYVTARREERRAVATAMQTMELGRQEALFRHGEKILEFRLKQMELFYAPMFALLKQSEALYAKMRYQLAIDDPARYQLLDEPDFEGYFLHVHVKDGSWKGFRLLDQLPQVRTNHKAFALVKSILEIGKKMTEIISEHAGLASQELAYTLGEYLAHYAILSTVYNSGEIEPYEPGWHKLGYYPRELNDRIRAGYQELGQFIDEYSKQSKRVLEVLPASK